MGRLKWSERNPDWKDSNGKPIYDRAAKVRIWSEKLKAEFFSTRKPTQTERLKIAAAVVLILDLSTAHEGFQANQPLPKNYIQNLNTLQRLLEGFKGKAPRGKKSGQTEKAGLGLAELLSGGEA